MRLKNIDNIDIERYIKYIYMDKENPILDDYVFKQVFGNQENERILISFLNAMLNGEYNIKSAYQIY